MLCLWVRNTRSPSDGRAYRLQLTYLPVSTARKAPEKWTDSVRESRLLKVSRIPLRYDLNRVQIDATPGDLWRIPAHVPMC